MPDTTWKLKAIFGEALDLASDEEREAYLKRVCGDDALLRREVDSLLAAHREADGFLNRVVPKLESPLPFPPIAERPGTQVGRYKLLEEIGEGGMGVVYEAEQQEPVHRKVALKIVKPGVDTREVIRRFEFERQALALMDHPNIAHMLDAGATELGRPYFVMELVEGTPITDYCDREELTVAQRLELFVLVCQAVQHAHQKGIIHRDLKPTNVLVAVQDAKPVPKIVDFGVAKAMGPEPSGEATATHAGQMVGTPLYMSPEQAEGGGGAVDTRSDVYSLGVVLYELLTGTTPFEKERFRDAGFEQVCAAIRSEDPPAPSSRISTLEAAKVTTISARRKTDRVRLSHLLRSDPDWIVMKALEKDPERRYATARDLAEDLRRFLEGEPIHARPPSFLDRVSKWTRRHRTAVVSAGSIIAILLVATTLVALGQRQVALSRSELAQQRLAVQTGINNALAEATRLRGSVPAGALGDQTALTLAREQVQRAVALAESGPADPQLTAQVHRLSSELDQEQRDRRLLADLDKAWLASATANAAEGRFAAEACVPLLREALEAYGLRAGHGPPDETAAAIKKRPEAVRSELLAALQEWFFLSEPPIGITLQTAGDRTRIRKVVSESPAGRDGRLKPGDELVGIGQGGNGPIVDTRKMKPGEILTLLCGEPGTLVRVEVTPKDGTENRIYEVRRDPILSWLEAVVLLADTDPWRRRVRAARILADEANGQAERQKLADEADIERQPVRVLTRLGNSLVAGDRKIAFLRRVWQRHPGDIVVSIALASGMEEAQPPQVEEAIRCWAVAVALRPESAALHTNLGVVLGKNGKVEEAIVQLREALRIDPHSLFAHNNLGIALVKQGKLDEAESVFRETIRIDPGYAMAHSNLCELWRHQGKLDRAIAEGREAARLAPNWHGAFVTLAAVLRDDGKLDEAIVEYGKAIRLEPNDATAHAGLGFVLRKQGKLDEAIVEYREVTRLRPDLAAAHANLGNGLRLQGKLDEAIAACREGIRLEPGQPKIHQDLGAALCQEGNIAEGMIHYYEALRLDPNRPSVCNDMAWQLATSADPKWRQPAEAVTLALKAVELSPKEASYWNTLAVARYRDGQWAAAITALQNSQELGSGSPAHDFIFLAMAHCQLGEKDKARQWYEKGVAWMKDKKPHDELARFRSEAEELMSKNAAEPKRQAVAPAPAVKGGGAPSK